VRHPVVPATFKNIGKSDQIAVDIGHRVLQRIPNAGLRGQVYDTVKFFCGKQRCHLLPIGDIHLDESEVRIFAEVAEATLLQIDVVIIVEIVDANDLIASLQQAQPNAHADKAGGPC